MIPIKKALRDTIADNSSHIGRQNAEIILQGTPGLQGQTAQVERNGATRRALPRQDTGRAQVHSCLATACSRHVEHEARDLRIFQPPTAQGIGCAILPVKT